VDTTNHPGHSTADETRTLSVNLNLVQPHKLQRLRGQSLLAMQRLAKSSTQLKASTTLSHAFGSWLFDTGAQSISYKLLRFAGRTTAPYLGVS